MPLKAGKHTKFQRRAVRSRRTLNITFAESFKVVDLSLFNQPKPFRKSNNKDLAFESPLNGSEAGGDLLIHTLLFLC